MSYAEISQRLDAVIYLLDKRPPLYVRLVLHVYKRWLESFIPD